MNLTHGTTFPGFGKRTNWQLGILAGGVALALSVGALSGIFERDSAPTTSPVTSGPPVAAAPLTRADTPSEVAYILVGTQAEAAGLASAISTDAASDPTIADATSAINVITLETPADEAAFNQAFITANAELTALGIGVQLIDLRQPASPLAGLDTASSAKVPQAIVYIVGSEAEQVALETQFHEAAAHAVDNTHRSTFVVDSPAQEALLGTLTGEAMTGAFEVVDLRN